MYATHGQPTCKPLQTQAVKGQEPPADEVRQDGEGITAFAPRRMPVREMELA